MQFAAILMFLISNFAHARGEAVAASSNHFHYFVLRMCAHKSAPMACVCMFAAICECETRWECMKKAQHKNNNKNLFRENAAYIHVYCVMVAVQRVGITWSWATNDGAKAHKPTTSQNVRSHLIIFHNWDAALQSAVITTTAHWLPLRDAMLNDERHDACKPLSRMLVRTLTHLVSPMKFKKRICFSFLTKFIFIQFIHIYFGSIRIPKAKSEIAAFRRRKYGCVSSWLCYCF